MASGLTDLARKAPSASAMMTMVRKALEGASTTVWWLVLEGSELNGCIRGGKGNKESKETEDER